VPLYYLAGREVSTVQLWQEYLQPRMSTRSIPI
jgi:hypothetical protein